MRVDEAPTTNPDTECVTCRSVMTMSDDGLTAKNAVEVGVKDIQESVAEGRR